jgi:hypothetical protein
MAKRKLPPIDDLSFVARPWKEGDSVHKDILNGICSADDGLTGPGHCGGKLVSGLMLGGKNPNIYVCTKCKTRWIAEPLYANVSS